jgi:hypothetical protein
MEEVNWKNNAEGCDRKNNTEKKRLEENDRKN